MATKKAAAAAKDPKSAVNDLLDGISAPQPKKKGKATPEATITDPKLIAKLKQWKKSKDDQANAIGLQKEAEEVLAPIAMSNLKEQMEEAGIAMPAINLIYAEGDQRHEVTVTCNKNAWTKIDEDAVAILREVFGADFDTYFEKHRVVSMTEAAMQDPVVIQDILTKVFGGDREKFAKFFSVTTTFAPRPVLWEKQYVDPKTTALIQVAKDRGAIAQNKPAFTAKG